jgi:carbonic anhydrase
MQVSGSISNTGHSVMFTVDNSTRHHINVTGGPLSYKYQFQEIHVHYGQNDDWGSEHSINGYAFPAEVHALAIFPQVCPTERWPRSSEYSCHSNTLRL